MKHTQGPWRVRESTNEIVGFDNGGCEVRRAVAYGGSPEEIDANAALIAAAPSMKQALKALADVADLYAADQTNAKDPRTGLVQPITVEDGEELNNALRVAYAAIANAEGRE